MAGERTIHVLWTQKVIEAAVAAGAERAPLDALVVGELHEQRLSIDVHFAVWEHAMGAVADPAFPIAVATCMHIDDYETLGLACKTAPNLGAAVGRVARYLSIWTNAYECGSVDGDPARLIVQAQGAGPGREAAAESAVAEVLHVMRAIAEGPVHPLRAHFRHTRVGAVDAHESFFACELRFGSGFDGLELSPETLEIPLALADDGLSRYLESQLEQLSATAAPAPLADQVRRLVSDELPNGVPKIDQVARRLGVSRRSLQRELAPHGGYASVVDQTRRRLSETLLVASRHTLGEIAFLVGFSEPSAFHRAFKRWSGTTPASFRRAASDT